jgi:tight adherence protein B
LKAKRPTVRVASTLLRQAQQLSAVPSFDAALQRSRNLLRPLELLLEQSGTRMTVGTFLLTQATVAALVAFVATSITGVLLLGLAAAAFAAYLPVQFLRFQRTRRILKFEEQFPEALALVSRALKAGHTFTTGLAMIAEEMPKPIGPEFKLLYDQQNYGLAMPDALRLLAERIPILDARFFVTAVLIQRESGGNLSEVLDNLAKVMRDRFRVKRQMRVLSAHGRITGWVLVAMPPVLGVALMTINDEHRTTMFNDPLGHQMMFGGVALQVIGTLIIRKIVNVEY